MAISKIDALRILGHAYWHTSDIDAKEELDWQFNRIRRSLTTEDLKPEPKCAEGFNGKGPAWL